MANLILLSQIVIAVSVYYVWIFRYFNVIKEFEQFGLSDVTRNFVGAAKISMSALLLVGIWFPAGHSLLKKEKKVSRELHE